MLSRSSFRIATATALRRTQARSLSTISRTSTTASALKPHKFSSPIPFLTRSYASTPMAAPTDTAAESVAESTGITPDSMASTLRTKLEATHVDIQDISGGCGASFAAMIVSPQFAGKTALARHRLVNGVLKEEIKAIHAWTPRCLTPEQWEKEKEKIKGDGGQ